jgi:hypothetical protein
VRAHRRRRQVELLGDRLGRVAAGEQVEHLALARRQPTRRPRRRAQQLARDVGPAARHDPDRVDELVDRAGLADDPLHRSLEDLTQLRRVVDRREHDDAHPGVLPSEHHGEPRPALAGEPQVQHDDRRAVRADDLGGAGDVARALDDPEPGRAQQRLRRLAHSTVILDEHHARRRRGCRHRRADDP